MVAVVAALGPILPDVLFAAWLPRASPAIPLGIPLAATDQRLAAVLLLPLDAAAAAGLDAAKLAVFLFAAWPLAAGTDEKEGSVPAAAAALASLRLLRMR